MSPAGSVIEDDDPVALTAKAHIRAGDVDALRALLVQHPGLAASHLLDSSRKAKKSTRSLLHVATDWPGNFPNVADTIALLVQAGADPNARCDGPGSETPLHWAASSDDVAAIDALIAAGADIEARGAVIAGGTPIADATAFGQWNAAQRLLDHGARSNLFESATVGLVDRVQAHLDAGVVPTEQITHAFWGACHGGRRATAELLLGHGADIDWRGWDDLTPLDAALRSEAHELADWLRARGATDAR